MATAHLPGTKSSRSSQAQCAAAVAVIQRAADVIGDRDRALRWMGTPVPALSYATQVSLLGSKKGRDTILAALHNLEHGVL